MVRDIRDTVARRVFTGFLKKFFRFSFAGGVVRVALPGRTFPTLSLSSPVGRIYFNVTQKVFLNLKIWSDQWGPLFLKEAIKKHSTSDAA